MLLKRSIAVLLLAGMLAGSTMPQALAEGSPREDIAAQVAESAGNVFASMSDDTKIYDNVRQASRADTLPERLDLRERGVVPAIRSQGSFGTCWSFASVAASEISLLTDLGMTAQEYLEREGSEMNLSERHLAWFFSVPIPEEEGMDEHDLAQVGEGTQLLNDDGAADSHLSIGGLMSYASGMFASGMGPTLESLVPYTANDGSSSMAKDWSVDESLRFSCAWELKDSSFLPSPAERDADGNYVYNPIAVEMIKQELLNGRGVSVAYHSDTAMDPDAERNYYKDILVEQGYSEEIAEWYLRLLDGAAAVDEIPEEFRNDVRRLRLSKKMDIPFEEITDDMLDDLEAQLEAEEAAEDEAELMEEDAAELAEKEAAAREAAERFGFDPDELWGEDDEEEDDEDEAEEQEEINYINTETYAHYVWNTDEPADHAVVIIGYDDNYSADNFLPDHRPPADGAWIVRNSWGRSYGIDGCFYLSYYDQSICLPETFEFVTDTDSQSASRFFIEEYDFMPSAGVHTDAYSYPVYLANEFTIKEDSVLTYISTMTANLDTNVTAAVYLLKEDAQSPIDGELLDVRNVSYKYAGYHRITLSQHYSLPAGSRISVVETQRYHKDDGLYYALPYTLSLNNEFSRTYNALVMEEALTTGTEGRVGRGESFVGAEGQWFDWLDIVNDAREVSSQIRDFIAFDNLSMKIYLYQHEDIFGQHSFGDPVPYGGGSMRLCTECGYTLAEK